MKDTYQNPPLGPCHQVGCTRRIPRRFWLCSFHWRANADDSAFPDNPFLEDTYITRMRNAFNNTIDAMHSFATSVRAQAKEFKDFGEAMERAGVIMHPTHKRDLNMVTMTWDEGTGERTFINGVEVK